MTNRGGNGSSLIEVLVAMLILVSGVLAMAQLFLAAASSNAASRDTTIAATLAAQGLEQLVSSELADAAELVEHVDAWGRVVSTADSPPPEAVYTRRSSVEPFSADTVRIRVRVGRTDRTGSTRMPGETRVLTIARKRP
jgi:type IV pilus modification protein PilV